MQKTTFLPVISALFFLATAASAAEIETVGTAKTGQEFTLTYGFPADPSRFAELPLPPNTAIQLDNSSGVQVSARKTKNSPELYSESQCIILYGEFIACSSQPKNALSGVLYKYKGMNKAGDGVYSCVTSCSDRAPRTLLEREIPSGC